MAWHSVEEFFILEYFQPYQTAQNCFLSPQSNTTTDQQKENNKIKLEIQQIYFDHIIKV